MSILEFQVKTSVFLAAQRNALRSMKICPLAPSPQGIVIDKVEFGGNTIRHNADEKFSILFGSLTSYAPGEDIWSRQTQIAQDVTVYVTTMQDILSHPNQPPAIIIALRGTVIFNLDFYSLEEDCYLTTRFAALEPGPLPPLPPGLPVTLAELLASAESALRAAIPSKAIPAGLSSLTSMFAKFQNAGVSVDEQLQRIAFRAQIGGSNPDVKAHWQVFLDGNFPDRLAGADWSFHLDAGLITEFVKAKVNQLLSEANIDHLQTFVGCSYSNGGGKAVFTLNVQGIYDLPDPLGTIYRDVNLPMEISVVEASALRLHADYGEVLALIHSFDMIEFFLPSLSNGIEGLVQIAIGSALTDSNKKDNAPYCKKVSSTVVECTKSLQMPSALTGTVTILTQLNALDDGFALAGTMRSTDLSPSSIRTFVREFKFQAPEISCSSASLSLVAAFQQNAASAKVLHGEAVVDNQGAAPIFLCSWTVLNDPQRAFPMADMRVDAGPAAISFVLDIASPPTAYFQLPKSKQYPCDLLVTTTAGTRLLRLQPPPQITQVEISAIAAALLVKVGNCEKLMRPWFEEYLPGWGLSDAHIESPLEHLWQVTITGLDAGQSISLVNSSKQELVHATAQAGAPLRLSALVAPSPKNELTILRRGANPGQVPVRAKGKRADAIDRFPDDGRGIEVGQHQVIQLGSIPLNAVCLSLQVTPIRAGACILAVLTDGLRAYDLSDPRRPTQVKSWSIPGLRGVVTWQGALLHFGDEGFGWIDAEGRRSAPSHCCNKPVLDATPAGRSLYALVDTGLATFSASLCQTSLLPMEDARCLTRTAGKLVIGGRRGLSVRDVPAACHPQAGASLDGIDVKRVARPLGSGPGVILASLADGSARLLDVADSSVQETAAFRRSPWFDGSVRLRDVLIRIGSNGRSLDISRFAASGVM